MMWNIQIYSTLNVQQALGDSDSAEPLQEWQILEIQLVFQWQGP